LVTTGRVPLEAALVRVWRAGIPLGAGFLADGEGHLKVKLTWCQSDGPATPEEEANG